MKRLPFITALVLVFTLVGCASKNTMHDHKYGHGGGYEVGPHAHDHGQSVDDHDHCMITPEFPAGSDINHESTAPPVIIETDGQSTESHAELLFRLKASTMKTYHRKGAIGQGDWERSVKPLITEGGAIYYWAMYRDMSDEDAKRLKQIVDRIDIQKSMARAEWMKIQEKESE